MVKYSQNAAGLIGPPIEPKKPKKRRKYKSPRRKIWKRSELIRLLRIKATGLGRSPTTKEVAKDRDMPSVGAYIKRFGTWNLALIAADLKPRHTSTSISKAEKERRWAEKRSLLLEQYIKKWEELGHVPMIEEINADPTMFSATTYKKYFGDFSKLLAELDEDPNIRHYHRADGVEYNQDYLCRVLRKKWRELGRTPTMREVAKDYNLPSTHVYLRNFGTWTHALEVAKIPLNQRNAKIARDYTDEQLLQILRDLYDELGRVPVEQDISFDPSLPSANTFSRRLGSFAAARRLAGIPNPDEPSKTKVRVREKSPKWSTEAVAMALYNKTKQLGHMPSWSEVNSDSTMPCMNTVRKHFASTEAALQYVYEARPWLKTSDGNTSFIS